MNRKINNLLKSLEKNGFESYIVGGYVRDKLLNKESYDIDICTSAKPEEIQKIFPFAKNNDFFGFSLKLDNYNIEITSFRKDSCYDGRKPKMIEYSTLDEDLQRRDFTINTMLLDSKGHIIDKLNGLNDLKLKKIKVVGNSDKKIKEDSLRILRAIRFASILNFKLDQNLEKTIIKYANNVSKLSIYRKRSELDKIITNKNMNYGIKLIKKFNLDKVLNISIPNTIKYCTNYTGIYAQMKINIDNFFTNKELKQIKILQKYLHKDLKPFDLYNLGYENTKIIDEINNSKFTKLYNNLPIKKESDVHISYNDVSEILNQKKLTFSKIKLDIIKNIIDKKLPNNTQDIIDYINNNY